MGKFLRRVWSNYSKLGRGRKKKQVWRRPRGRDNKMREKRRGYPSIVSIGYKKKNAERKEMIIIRNSQDLEKNAKSKALILGNIGKKKKIEILKKAQEMKIPIQNVNIKKFLEKQEKRMKKKIEKKEDKFKQKKAEKHAKGVKNESS